MKKPLTHPPDWLPELLRKMDRLTFWELLAEEAPVKPARKRLKLEKITDEPDASQKHEFVKVALCMAMAMAGRTLIRLVAGLAESARDPGQTGEFEPQSGGAL